MNGGGLISLVCQQGDLKVVRSRAGYAGPEPPGCFVESAAISVGSSAGHADADGVGVRQSPCEASKVMNQLGITE